MVPLSSPETAALAEQLVSYDPRVTVPLAAALLTVPEFQANAIRIEVLLHLAVAKCAGSRRPRDEDLEHWLNDLLNRQEIVLLEDPPEDLFITNVQTPEGNQHLFEGLWESSDYFVQSIIDTLLSRAAPLECRQLLNPTVALLRISNAVARRLGLHRWHTEPSSPGQAVRLSPALQLNDRARAVTFNDDDLRELGLGRDVLAPFILRDTDKSHIAGETTGDSSLERKPLIDCGDTLVLALPSAVSPAIRHFLVAALRDMGYLQAFERAIAVRQSRELEDDCLNQLRGEAEPIRLPGGRAARVSLHGWLIRYDLNKYIHIVLLHDHMESFYRNGLSTPLRYPEPQRASLEQHLQAIATYCRSRPDCAEGMTLIVLGGLGRGLALAFRHFPPSSWPLSVIMLPDLLTLSRNLHRPLDSFLKLIRQKFLAEQEGIVFQLPNGDFNLFSYWKSVNYQLVPRPIRLAQGSVFSLGPEFIFSTRERIRTLADRHLAEMEPGTFTRVMRFGTDAYFTSMQRRPIYASIDHAQEKILAGVVETSRGSTWLTIDARELGTAHRDLAYQLWSGFIGLYDRVVSQVEAAASGVITGTLEVRLAIQDVRLPENGQIAVTDTDNLDIAISLDEQHRRATVSCPPAFLANFQRSENVGERKIAEALVHALAALHGTSCPQEQVNQIVDTVIGSRVRILHLFQTYNPVEYLLARHAQEHIFLSQEDFTFAKLKLSEGCTTVEPGGVIQTKEACNAFLHRVVNKTWSDLRTSLRHFDRADLLRRATAVHEALLQDRDHWRRTAQAVIALHETERTEKGLSRLL